MKQDIMPASMGFGRELHLPCNLLLGALSDEQPMIDYMVDLVEWLHDTHQCNCQHLKVTTTMTA
jgi:hypothetical protein